ncbi:DNA cytosine methyltransferase [Slackia piriformis]|nr:DNA cytosine methyltransferase [Slackia piriformis]
MLQSIEICAGAGGQALGLEQAGFHHCALVELDEDACKTLCHNRPAWNVLCEDVKAFSAASYSGIDLLAGGVPCPPFSIAGKQLGKDDERDLFPEAIRLVSECHPKAVMIENVKGLFAPKFDGYRAFIVAQLEELGYECHWGLVNASDYGVSQLRPRTILVALKQPYARYFQWPETRREQPLTVGQLLFEEMSSNGWEGAAEWAERADAIAPTLVGGSKKHGGPDLGPTRAKKAWELLGVNGKSIAEEPPSHDFNGMPRLTVPMAALVQGFPKDWEFVGKKTAAYRQVGNAFPPPVAKAFGDAIARSIHEAEREHLADQDTAGAVSPVSAR